MKTRIISGLVMAPLLILVIVGGPCVTALGFIVALMGIKEFFNGFGALGVKPSYPIACVSVVLLYGIEVLVQTGMVVRNAEIYMFWLFISVIMCLLYLFKINERKLEDALATITGIVYIGFFSYHVVLTEAEYHTSMLDFKSPVWFILITAFCTDIFAYFGGYFLGKHKLCPVISPKKTIEGAVSGVLGSVVISVLYGCLALGSEPERIALYIFIGIFASIMSQFGDLTASIFKRKMGIKDYGKLIPGHGGIMDRFDSVLFTAPVVYYIYTAFTTAYTAVAI